MSVLDGIKKAFKLLPELGSAIGQVALIVVIMAIVIGAFIYQATTGGAIQIDGNATTGSYQLVAAQSTNFSTIMTTIWSAATSTAGFIVLGVIALLVASILGKKFMGGTKL